MIEIGNFEGKKVYKITIENENLSADIISYGASLQTLNVKHGKEYIDVVLGYDTLDGYLADKSSIGRTVGRVCNRIKDAKFTLNGNTYTLCKNNGENCLHGGFKGFGYKVWDVVEHDKNSVTLSCFSPDGEEGFPGNITAKTTYSIKGNCLIMEHSATADQDTIVSMTNHSYFNLNGQGSGSVLSHRLRMPSQTITPVDKSLCTFNTFMDISNTAFDFSDYKELGKDIEQENELLKTCNGYDHNYVLSGDLSLPVATIIGDKTGLTMRVFTDQKGMHVYTANFLTLRQGKGATYDKRHAVCFETQCPPNAINCPDYPSPILRKGQTYKSTTKFCFDSIK